MFLIMFSGTYKYFLNGEPTGITETFRIEILSNGEKQTISERDTSVFDSIITVKTTEKDGNFQTAEIIFKKAETKVKAVYEFAAETFRFKREINGEISEDEIVDLPYKCVFFPLMRCFQGQTILQVAKNQGFTTVLVPDIQNPNDVQSLLKPTFDERTGEGVGLGTINYENHLTDVIVYKYISRHYDENSEFWIIRRNSLLFSYEYPQSEDKIWEVYLEN